MDFAALVVAVMLCLQAATPSGAQAGLHYQKGLEYSAKGLWAAAIAELNQARQLEPSNAEVLVELGIAYGERQQWSQASESLRKAVVLAPRSARAHYNLALTLDRWDPGKGAGIAEYRKALAIDPNYVDALMNLAIDLGDRSAADGKPLFDKAIRLAPKNAGLHLNYALLLKREGDESASIAEFQRAIDCNPDLMEARHQLTSMLMAGEKWNEAIEQCREILKRTPEDAASSYTLARALSRAGQEEESKREMEHAQGLRKFEQRKQEAEGLQREGLGLLEAGQAQAAVKALEPAVKLDGSALNHMYLGLALAASGNAPGGIGELQAAIEREPANARAHVNLGSVYLQSGQADLGKAEINKALELDPWLPEAHNNYGLILANSNQLEGAARQFQMAVDLDPQYAEALFNLGLAFRMQKQLDKAVKAFRRAVAVSPNNAQAQRALAMVLKEQAASHSGK